METAHTATTRMITATMPERREALDIVRDHLGCKMPYRISTDASEQAANLRAATGPRHPGKLPFGGCVDPVPVDDQVWTGDPFAPRPLELRRPIQDLAESGLRPNLWLTDQPSGMQPILANMGKLDLQLLVRELPGEPSKDVNTAPAAGAGSRPEACDRVIRRLADRLPA